MLLLRKGLCRQRCRRIHPRRDRGQGPQACDPPSALAPGLRLRVVADRSVGAPGAAAVPQDALRDQLLGALPVRTLRLLPPPAPGCRVDVRPGAADLAGDAGQQPEALRAAVRAGGRCDPRAPERGGAAPCRRDRLARPGASRGRPVEPRVAVDLGQQRRGLFPYRPFAQRRGGARAVRRSPPRHGYRLRPLQCLQAARSPSRGAGDPCVLLEPSTARLYRVCGRPGEPDAMVPGMGRADRGALPPERGASGALRPRP